MDIRSERERAEDGRVAGASFVPRSVLEWRADPACGHHAPALAEVEGPLNLMCAQGYRSSLAAATLQQLGLANATDMVGGFAAWQAAGLSVVPGEAAHWDELYERLEPTGTSWYQREPSISLELIAASTRWPNATRSRSSVKATPRATWGNATRGRRLAIDFPGFGPGASARVVRLDRDRALDYDADGRLVSMELLNVSRGVSLDDLPEARS